MLGIDTYGSVMVLVAPFIAVQLYIGTISAELFSRMISSFKDGGGSEISSQILISVVKFELRSNAWFILLFIFFIALLNSFEIIFDVLDGISFSLLGLFAISTFFYQTFIQIYLIKTGFLRLFFCYTIEAAIAPLIIFFFLYLDPSKNMMVAALMLKNFLVLTLTLIFFKKNWILVETLHKKSSKMKTSLSNIPFHNSSLILKTLWTNLDMVAVSYISGNASAGEFRIIKSISSLPSLIASPWWNSVRSKIIKYIAREKISNLKKIVTDTARQLLPLVFISLIFIFFSEIFFKEIYLIEVSASFKLIFGIYFFAYIFSNVLTAWGRYIQVAKGTLTMSFYLNLFMVLNLILPILAYYFLSIIIPVPAVIGFGMLICSLFYWNWLRIMPNSQ